MCLDCDTNLQPCSLKLVLEPLDRPGIRKEHSLRHDHNMATPAASTRKMTKHLGLSSSSAEVMLQAYSASHKWDRAL